MEQTILIASRFNGPPDSGNGGYSCGLLAAFIDGPARVRLHRPPPLDRPLAVRRPEDGSVALFDGEDRVASAVKAELMLDVPPAPTPDEARDAATRYACYQGHVFPTCFVCGPGRPDHDGLAIYAGPTADAACHASPWHPAADLLDEAGNVRPEIVWSALDCPGYFASMGTDIRPAVLGELHADAGQAVPGDRPLVVYAWLLGSEGRKLYAGSAVADAEGRILARARATWILLREGSFGA